MLAVALMSIACLLVNSLLISVILFLPCYLWCVQSRASEPAGETESLEDESTGRVFQSSGGIEVSRLREE